MIKQFLLNADGTAPVGIDLARLIAEGIPLVLPTKRPVQPDMVAMEQDPQLGADGVWRQVWTLEPAPPAEPVPEQLDLLAGLTDEQKGALIALLTPPE